MGKKVVDKGLVFVIIMLFVGAGVTPCLTNFTVEASDGNSNFGFDSCIECGCGDNNNTTNSPTNLLTESTIKYYQSVGSQCFGLSDGGTSQLAMRITPKELSTYSGWSLKAGRFYHCSSNSCTGYLKIYSKGTSTSPGSLLAQKRYSISGAGWVRIDLDQPIQLDITKDYWISIEYTNAKGEYPFGADTGPAIDGKGDWCYYYDVGWYEIQNQAIVYPGTNSYEVNWNIEAIVSSPTGNRPPVANAGGPYHAEPGVEIQFDGSNSYDPDGYITSYEWNFGDGQTGSGVKPKHTYSTENDYTVTLTVTDNAHVLASSTHSILLPIWFLTASVTEISSTNDINIQDINDPIWSKNTPKERKPIADDLQNGGSGSFTINAKFFSFMSMTSFNFGYEWHIFDQNGNDIKNNKRGVVATGSGQSWQGSFNVQLPSKVGKYTFNFMLVYGFGGSFYFTTTLYVTWGDPLNKPVGLAPLELATKWASGLSDGASIVKTLTEKINYEPKWKYKGGESPPGREDHLIETYINNPGNSQKEPGSCGAFARVLIKLSGVLGINVKEVDLYNKQSDDLWVDTNSDYDVNDKNDYEFKLDKPCVFAFLTNSVSSIDGNTGNAYSNNWESKDKWVFHDHAIVYYDINKKYYDPTFRVSQGFSDAWGNIQSKAYYEVITSLSGMDENNDGVIDYYWPGSTEYALCKNVKDTNKQKITQETPTTEQQKIWGKWKYAPFTLSSLLNKSDEDSDRLVTSNNGANITDYFLNYGVDNDSNGLNDYLVVETEINVNIAGNYILSTSLLLNKTSFIRPIISSFEPSLSSHEYFDTGIHKIAFFILGKDIFDLGVNGKYKAAFALYDENHNLIDTKIFNTSSYNFTDFQGLLVNIKNIDDHGTDLDGNGLYDYLRVEITAQVEITGKYTLGANLFSDDEGFVDTKLASINLSQGNNTVLVDFDGKNLYQKRINGPYTLSLWLSDNKYQSNMTYTTSKYNYITFEKPGAYFTKVYSDKGTDLNNNGLYEYLTVKASIFVNTAGNYIIQGSLEKDTTWATASGYFNTGSQDVLLHFDGTAIYRLWENGPYLLSHIAILDENSLLQDAISDSYTTSFYNYADFEPPTAFIQDVYSDYGIDTNNNKLYEYLAVQINLSVISTGNYTLVGSLTSNNNQIIAVASNIAFLVPIVQSITLFFDGPTIYQHGIDGPYVLGSIALFNENGTLMDSQNNISNIFAYHYTDFEGGSPDLKIDITGDIGVNAVIMNNGTANASGIEWQIHVEGGILGKINKTINGTVDIPVGESKTVGTGILFGLGPITITVKVADEEKTAEGTQFIIFSKVK